MDAPLTGFKVQNNEAFINDGKMKFRHRILIGQLSKYLDFRQIFCFDI